MSAKGSCRLTDSIDTADPITPADFFHENNPVKLRVVPSLLKACL